MATKNFTSLCEDSKFLLIWDTYEAHISNNVLSFLNKHKNIKVHTIVGGMTSTDQPLDISMNKAFKTICKKESVKFTNAMLEVLNVGNIIQKKQENVNTNLISSKLTFFFKGIIFFCKSAGNYCRKKFTKKKKINC